ncbi:MAG: glycosyltransferase family 4 protein [Anaerolineae bacterium]
MIFWIPLAIIITVISYLGVSQIRSYVLKQDILDIPNHRSSHKVPTPSGGGLVMVIAVLVGLLIYLFIYEPNELTTLGFYIFGAAAIALVSWIDDVRTLPAYIRFGIHFLCAGLVIWKISYFSSFTFPTLGTTFIGTFGVFFTFLWLSGLTNAYNFMDGIDGIAGGQAAVAGLGWAIIGWWLDDPIIILWGILIAFSALGFLFHNWSPATIFMGDVGSAFLGYTFATLPVFLYYRHANTELGQYAILVGVLLVWPFILDAFFTFFRRLLKGENVFKPHRSHLYQKLIISGYQHQFVSSLYILLAFTALPLLWLAREDQPLTNIAFWIFLISLVSFLFLFVFSTKLKVNAIQD